MLGQGGRWALLRTTRRRGKWALQNVRSRGTARNTCAMSQRSKGVREPVLIITCNSRMQAKEARRIVWNALESRQAFGDELGLSGGWKGNVRATTRKAT
jgi:hypothetical protein